MFLYFTYIAYYCFYCPCPVFLRSLFSSSPSLPSSLLSTFSYPLLTSFSLFYLFFFFILSTHHRSPSYSSLISAWSVQCNSLIFSFILKLKLSFLLPLILSFTSLLILSLLHIHSYSHTFTPTLLIHLISLLILYETVTGAVRGRSDPAHLRHRPPHRGDTCLFSTHTISFISHFNLYYFIHGSCIDASTQLMSLRDFKY